MGLVAFKKNIPPLFIERRRRQKRLMIFKLAVFSLIAFFLFTVVVNYYAEEGKNINSQNKTAKEKSETVGALPNIPAAQLKPPAPTTFSFAGDLMFDRLVNHRFLGDKIFEIFANFDRSLLNTDLSVANLEGPISNQPINDDPNPSNLNFLFPPKTAEVLKYINLDAVSLANNHTLNAGETGLTTTKEMLSSQGVDYFGLPDRIDSSSTYHSKTNTVQVSVIAVNTLNTFEATAVIDLISNEKKAGYFVIVFPHWSAEYQTKHSTIQEKLATDWIQAGADLIIGSHPHVIQDAQRINGVPVFYSLGNFVFDQTFSVPTQRGLILTGQITTEHLDITPNLIKIVNLKPTIATTNETTELARQLANQLSLAEDESFDPTTGTIHLKRR